ncbi:MAG: hypothetical protein QOH03_1657 [Kribbellaceae bacterium]|nr:hypothetical protein [Kribbellaceae bacterium]
MSTATTTTRTSSLPMIGGWAATIGGLTITALGIVGAVWPDSAEAPWFAVAGAAAILLALGLGGMRVAVKDVPTAYRALLFSEVTMLLFALAHFYAVVDVDTAIPLFSGFMLLSAIGLTIAGVAVLRARIWPDRRRFALLATGIWPALTIPAGAAAGDIPHFTAIAVWGLLWTTLGAILLNTGVRHP